MKFALIYFICDLCINSFSKKVKYNVSDVLKISHISYDEIRVALTTVLVRKGNHIFGNDQRSMLLLTSETIDELTHEGLLNSSLINNYDCVMNIYDTVCDILNGAFMSLAKVQEN